MRVLTAVTVILVAVVVPAVVVVLVVVVVEAEEQIRFCSFFDNDEQLCVPNNSSVKE